MTLLCYYVCAIVGVSCYAHLVSQVIDLLDEDNPSVHEGRARLMALPQEDTRNLALVDDFSSHVPSEVLLHSPRCLCACPSSPLWLHHTVHIPSPGLLRMRTHDLALVYLLYL